MRSKRMISLLVAICLLVAILPVGAVPVFAEDNTFSYEYKGQTLHYKVIDETNSYVELSRNENIKGAVVVPEKVTDEAGKTYTVTQIGSYAINNSAMTSIELPETIKKIASSSFNNNWSLTDIHIPASVEFIGEWAFQWCGNMTSVTFEENSSLKTIDGCAFAFCQSVETISLPEGLKTIGQLAFKGCSNLKEITIPSTVTSIGRNALASVDNKINDSIVVKYTGTQEAWESITKSDSSGDQQVGTLVSNIHFPKTLNFELNGHGAAIAPRTVYDGDKVVVKDPVAKGYKFAGWYSDADLTKAFDPENDPITKEMTTLYADWQTAYDLTVKGGTVKVNGADAVADADGVYAVAEGEEVEVTFDKGTLSDAQVFDQWSVMQGDVLSKIDPRAEKIRFVMPAGTVNIEAMTRDASIEEENPDLLGAAAMIGVAGVSAVAIGYQGYMLGTEFALICMLPSGTAIPQNRAELAMLLWTDAGEPEPAEKALYTDLDAEDTAAQQAARWAVETQLMDAAQDDSDSTFDPSARVTNLEVIRSWKKAQKQKA